MEEVLYNDPDVRIDRERFNNMGREYFLKEIVSIDTVGMTNNGGIGVIEGIAGLFILFAIVAFVQSQVLIGVSFIFLSFLMYFLIKKFFPTNYRVIITTGRGTTEVISSTDQIRISKILTVFNELNIR